MGPTTLPTFHLTLLIFHSFFIHCLGLRVPLQCKQLRGTEGVFRKNFVNFNSISSNFIQYVCMLRFYLMNTTMVFLSFSFKVVSRRFRYKINRLHGNQIEVQVSLSMYTAMDRDSLQSIILKKKVSEI